MSDQIRIESHSSAVVVAWQRLADALLAVTLTEALVRADAPSAPLVHSLGSKLQWALLWLLSLSAMRFYSELFERSPGNARSLRGGFAWLLIGLPILLSANVAHVTELYLLGFAIPWILVAFQRFVWWLANAISPNDVRRVLIVGVTPTGCEVYRTLASGRVSNAVPLGFVEYRAPDRVSFPEGARYLGPATSVGRIAREMHADVVLITLPLRDEKRVHDLLLQLNDSAASVAFVPDLLQFDLLHSSLGYFANVPAITLRGSPMRGFPGMTKQLLDLFVALALLVALSPLLFLSALAVALSSRGPILFTQRRYGLGGQEVLIYKFRTMHFQKGVEDVSQAVAGDKRVTLVGRILRKLSIDELPQLVNVLQGRMSLVGPRPHAAEHNEMYRKIIPGYMLRHTVRPGLTGWAQVHGFRGPTLDPSLMEKRVEYDAYYLRHWSLALDLWILVRTPWAILRPAKGAV